MLRRQLGHLMKFGPRKNNLTSIGLKLILIRVHHG